MTSDTPPKFLSLQFHTRFFPALLWRRLRFGKSTGSGFSSSMELYLVLAGCGALIAIGVPAALLHGSIAGWIAGALGAAGILAMLVRSIASCRGETPSWDGFLAGCFSFLVTAGTSVAVFLGTLEHYTLYQALSAGGAGLIAGYLLGMVAGLVLQYLGWLSVLLDRLAGLAVIGMLVLDLVLLSGIVSK